MSITSFLPPEPHAPPPPRRRLPSSSAPSKPKPQPRLNSSKTIPAKRLPPLAGPVRPRDPHSTARYDRTSSAAATLTPSPSPSPDPPAKPPRSIVYPVTSKPSSPSPSAPPPVLKEKPKKGADFDVRGKDWQAPWGNGLRQWDWHVCSASR